MRIPVAIRNPLTVIAFFAGIAEVCSAVALPISPEKTHLMLGWFVVLFPTYIVTLFFITLNWNHRVLYAPSDFKTDKAFVDLLKPQSPVEREAKLAAEISDQSEVGKLLAEGVNNEDEKVIPQSSSVTKVPVETGSKEISQSPDAIVSDAEDGSLKKAADKRVIYNFRRREEIIVESAAIDRLSNEFGIVFSRNVKISVREKYISVDAVGESGGQEKYFVEIIRVRHLIVLEERLKRVIKSFQEIEFNFSGSFKLKFIIVFVIDESLEDRRERMLKIINSYELFKKIEFTTIVYRTLDLIRRENMPIHVNVVS